MTRMAAPQAPASSTASSSVAVGWPTTSFSTPPRDHTAGTGL
jgi:hypothetical protein